MVKHWKVILTPLTRKGLNTEKSICCIGSADDIVDYIRLQMEGNDPKAFMIPTIIEELDELDFNEEMEE